MTSAEIITACLGVGLPIGGSLFWLGKLQGHVAQLASAHIQLEKRINRLERRIEILDEKHATTDKNLVIIRECQEHILDGQKVLFTKIDELTKALTDHIVNS